MAYNKTLPEFVKALADLGRQGVIAQFTPPKGFKPVHRSFEFADAVEHVEDRSTFGVYLVRGDETQLAVLDLDNHDGDLEFAKIAELAVRISDVLFEFGMRPLMVRSGGGAGAHVWLAFENPQKAKAVRSFLRKILQQVGLRDGTRGVKHREAEIFPKQDSVPADGLGNLVALPFSRNSAPLLHYGGVLEKTRAVAPPIAKALSPDVPEVDEVSNQPRRYLSAPLPTDSEEAENALKFIAADDYSEWILIGLILKNHFGDDGFALWHKWSQTSKDKYIDETDCEKRWYGLKPRGAVGLGTLFKKAKEGGWNGPTTDPIREMNRSYGILTHGSKTLIILKQAERRIDAEFAWLGVEPFFARLAAEKIYGQRADGEPLSTPLAKHWMAHPHADHYYRVDFDPSLPPGHNGTMWNMWQGFWFQPIPGCWDLFQQHLLTNVCRGHQKLFEWLLNWFAMGLQRPGDIIGTAIVFRGAPGTGKSFVAERYGALWAPHYVAITQSAHVLGRFNSHLAAKRVVLIDEGMFGGNRKEAGVIKTRITEPYILIENKGVDPIKMRNRALFIIASNEDSIVPADLGDRRWMVFDVGNDHKEDHEYFSKIMEQMKNGGYEAMMYDLLNRDLSQGPDPRRIIKTRALFEQIIQAQPTWVQYIHHLLDEGRLPQNLIAGPRITTIRALSEDCRHLHPSDRHLTAIALGRHLRKVFPDLKTIPNGDFLVRYLPGRVPYFELSTQYTFPPLSTCRAQFHRYVGQSIPWSNDLDDWQSDPEPDLPPDDVL